MKPTVIFILGHAFSGSTLFSLALGLDKRFLNLGEVSILEHDYHVSTKCTCGKPLNKCPFYTKLKTELEARQSAIPAAMKWRLEDSAGSTVIGRRHRYNTIAQNVKLAMGMPVHKVYPDSEIQAFLKKNELFFKHVWQIFPENDFIIDCSKNPKQLEILLKSREVDLRVIYLKRTNEAAFASRMKRVKRRVPKSHANFLFRFFYSSVFALWQRSEMKRCMRLFNQADPLKRMHVSFDVFVENPVKILNDVHQWLGIGSGPRMPAHKDALDIRPCDQHIYVGNRWLFKDPEKPVRLELTDDSKSLTFSQRLAMKLILTPTKRR